MLALGQLAAIELDGGKPDEVLTWALARGLSGLADCARRMTADAAKEKNHANHSTPSRKLSVAEQVGANARAIIEHEQRSAIDGEVIPIASGNRLGQAG